MDDFEVSAEGLPALVRTGADLVALRGRCGLAAAATPEAVRKNEKEAGVISFGNAVPVRGSRKSHCRGDVPSRTTCALTCCGRFATLRASPIPAIA